MTTTLIMDLYIYSTYIYSTYSNCKLITMTFNRDVKIIPRDCL